MPNGAPGEPVLKACDRYQDLAEGLPGGNPAALARWTAAGPRSKGCSTPPRARWSSGARQPGRYVVLGNGIVVSTDDNAQTHRDQAGKLSAGPINDIDNSGEGLGWRVADFQVGSKAVQGLEAI